MKYVWLFVLVGLVFTMLACGSTVPTVTSVPEVVPITRPTFTPSPAPTATPSSVSTLALTPTFTHPSASYILESAIENLRAAPSFHLAAGISGNNALSTFITADIINPDWGYVYESSNNVLHGYQEETLTLGKDYYYRPAGFQVWFDAGKHPNRQREIQGFPYELSLFRMGIRGP